MTYPKKTRKKALELAAQGISTREIGRRIKVHWSTVDRWVSAGAETARAAEPAEPIVGEGGEDLPVEAPAPIPPLAPSAPIRTAEEMIAHVQRQLDRTIALSERAEGEGNTTAAQKFGRDAVVLMTTLRQLLTKSQDSDGKIVLSKAEIARAQKEVSDKHAALARAVFLCPECGSKMRARMAKGEV